ncbi:MAG: hypothetical protein AB7K24_19625 [Gemmataceae bacterium]
MRDHGQGRFRAQAGNSPGRWLLAPALVVGMLAGCNSTRQAAAPAAQDPLLGMASTGSSTPTPPAPPTPVTNATPTAQPTGKGLTPLPPPPPTALTSNAALAGATPNRTYDPSNDLRIPGRPDPYGIGAPAPTPRPTTFAPPAFNPPPTPPASNSTGVVLSRPVAPTPTATPTSNRPPNPTPPAPPPPASNGSGQAFSYEEAQRLLKARGVNWQRLETWGDKGEWKFSCSVPNPQNAFISRNYDAKAMNYLDAMRAVLEQMDRERR